MQKKMNVKKLLSPLVPGYIKDKIRSKRETSIINEFTSLAPQDCHATNLRSIKGFSLPAIFDSPEIQVLWNNATKEIGTFDIPDGTGGVNPGDRRAIYYLISALKPGSTLEVGTHIGASTLHIASALFSNQITNGSSGR